MNEPPITPEQLLAHRDRLRALVSNLLLDEDSVEDVLQEVWLAALKKPPGRFRALSAWLVQVARNLALRSRRDRARRTQREQMASRPEAISPDTLDEERQRVLVSVTEAVSALNESHRRVVALRFFEGLTVSEIADYLNAPRATVKSRLQAALVRLRGRLRQELGEDRDAWCLSLLTLLPAHEWATVAGQSGVAAGTVTTVAALNFNVKILVAVLIGCAAVTAIWKWRTASRPPESPPDLVKAETAVASARTAAPAKASSRPAAEATPAPGLAAIPPEILKQRTIHGTVTDPDGSPVSGATVRASLARHDWWEMMDSNACSTRTDEKGKYLLGPLRGRWFSVEATAPQRCRKRLPARVGTRLDFELGPPARLSGRVIRPRDDRPVAGANVIVFSEAFKAACEAHPHTANLFRYQKKVGPHWLERTDASGGFTFSNLPPGRFSIRVHPADSLPLETPFDAEVRAGRTTNRTLRLPDYEKIDLSGRVVDGQTGRPVPGVRVFLGILNPNQQSVTDAEGRYALVGLAPGRFQVYLHSKGHVPARFPVYCTDGQERFERNFALVRYGQVRGRVFGTGGIPLKGAEVGWESLLVFTETSLNARTDDTGTFVLHVEPGKERRAFAVAEGHALGASRCFDVDPGKTVEGIEIRLEKGGSFEGRMLDASGQPATGAAGFFPLPSSGERGHFRFPWRMLDADGRFSIHQIPPGRYQALRRWSGTIERYPQEVVIAGGETTRVTLTPRLCGRVLAGRLVDPSGRPVADVRVVACSVGPDMFSQTVCSGSDGRFRLDRIPRGLYMVHLQAPGFFSRTLENVRTGSDDLEITLQRTIPLQGRVLHAGTLLPATTFRLRIYDQSTRINNLSVPCQDARGRILASSHPHLPPGEYDVEACTATGLVSQRARRVVIRPGAEVKPLEFFLVPGGGVRGIVRRPDGEPLGKAHVWLQPTGNARSRRVLCVITDEGGRFHFGGLRAGEYRVKAFHSDWAEAEREIVVVRAGSETRIELAARQGRCLRIRVEDPTGRPVPRATIFLETDGGEAIPPSRWNVPVLLTDEGGSLRLGGLAPGCYGVEAVHPLWARVRARVVVRQSGEASELIRLHEGGALLVSARTQEGNAIEGARIEITAGRGEYTLPVARYHALFQREREKNPGLWWDEYVQTLSRTNPAGMVLRRFLPPGRYRVKTIAAGYESSSQTVQVSDRLTTRVETVLKKRAERPENR